MPTHTLDPSASWLYAPPADAEALRERVIGAAAAAEHGDGAQATAVAEQILASASPAGTAAERLARLFAEGLLRRLAARRSHAGDRYASAASPHDIIDAFNVLVERTPFMRFGYEAANGAILRATEGARNLHVIDVGIGTGAQWYGLLAAFAARDDRPRLRLTGIDVPAGGGDPRARLRATGAALTSHARLLGLDLEYDAIAGAVEMIDLSRLRAKGHEALAINAVFALHHVAAGDAVTDPGASRDALLARIGELHPAVFTLVEQDVEHNALGLAERVRDSTRHYLTVFDALATLLPPEMPERQTIETQFFGHQIFNSLEGEGSRRIERHERAPRWRARVRNAGFVPIDLGDARARVERRVGARPPFEVAAQEEALVLAWRGEPTAFATAWRPVR